MDKKHTLYIAEGDDSYGFDGEFLLKTREGGKTFGWWLGHDPGHELQSRICACGWGWDWNDGCDNAKSCREVGSSDDIAIIIHNVTGVPLCLCSESEEEEYDG